MLSIRTVADAMQQRGGMDAVQLQVAEKYLRASATYADVC
jgi:anaerobic C4-dicarboxylate transporter